MYGTADGGGSSRESLNTVHGYTFEPPTSPGMPPVVHANGTADTHGLASLNRLSTAGSTAFKSAHPGNDLPAHLATGPSLVDLKAASIRAARTTTPPIDTSSFSQAETGASKYPTPSTPPKFVPIFLETRDLSSSPTQSPKMESQHEADGIHSQLEAGEGTPSIEGGKTLGTSASPEGTQTTGGTIPYAAADTNGNEAGSMDEGAIRPSKSQTHSLYPIPSTSLLHPSSAAHPTTSGATTPKDVVSAVSRPIRRNTTGSTAAHPSKSKSQTPAGVSIATSTSGGAGAIIHDGWDPELDEDMKKQAEQIRRERKRRDLEAQEAERIKEESSGKRESKGKEKGHARSGSVGAKSTGGRSTGGKSLDEWKPIVGNVVGEGHVNYILMYNMLTGIRVAVSLFTLFVLGHSERSLILLFRSRDVKPNHREP